MKIINLLTDVIAPPTLLELKIMCELRNLLFELNSSMRKVEVIRDEKMPFRCRKKIPHDSILMFDTWKKFSVCFSLYEN